MDDFRNLFQILLKSVVVADMGNACQKGLIRYFVFVLRDADDSAMAVDDCEIVFKTVLGKPDLSDCRKIDIGKNDIVFFDDDAAVKAQ